MASLDDNQVDFIDTSYGKTGVKLLYVNRSSPRHEIIEYEVSTLLELSDRKDYVRGDNSAVIPTDTQKNTVYVAAQKYGVGCPEEFAMTLAKHFLLTYRHVISARIRVETVNGWNRMKIDGQDHAHAFISNPEAVRYAEVLQRRGEAPQVKAGLSGLRVLKTTQSAFINFHRCPYTTLKDAEDRILSTVVTANWSFSHTTTVNFTAVWETVRTCIIETFAGPAGTGIYSPSVQQTVYDIERLVLGKVPQIAEISMALPNVHYFDVDMTCFQDPSLSNTNNVYLPIDKPSGHIKASLRRRPQSKL